MVKVKVGDQEYYMDGIHKDNFDKAKKEVNNDWDFIFVYDGYEGTGKSVKAQQDAFYCDPTLTIDRITFTPTEFKKAIIDAKPQQAVIFDEAYGGLSSRASMTRVNRALVTVLTEIRQKNLYIFIVLPSFFDLDKYVALWRSRALIHIYTDGFHRGYFSFFNMDRKKNLYVNGKKYYNYNATNPNYRGRFTNYYTVDKEKYKQKKYDTLREKKEDEEDKDIYKQDLLKDIYVNIKEMAIGDKLQEKQIAQMMGISPPTLRTYRKSWFSE